MNWLKLINCSGNSLAQAQSDVLVLMVCQNAASDVTTKDTTPTIKETTSNPYLFQFKEKAVL